MIGKRFASSDGDLEKTAQINAIMNDVMQRQEAGAPIEMAALERLHPELMPELAEHLRSLRAIRAAREQVLQESRQSPAPESSDAWLEEDLGFLRRSLDKYDVLERVRYGGQGIVYKARQKAANRLVAIKVLLDGPLASERQRHRFEREIELVSRLRHPNIVALHDSGTIRGRHYFAMDFVDGLPIDDYVLLHDLTPREIVRLFVKVCRAVGYAHQNGIIHRDLSPANILVDDDGEPHVFDFGLAKDVWASGDAAVYSFTGQVIGTLPYLSPEQAGGLDGRVDVRSDIYTLGVVLYELLTDGFPYPTKGEPQQVRNAILTAEARPLRRAAALGGANRIRDAQAINRDLEMILDKALTKDKGGRYQSAAAFADDLGRYLAGDAVAARADNHFYLLRKTLRRYRVPMTVAGIVLLTLAVSLVAVTAIWMQVRAERDNARRAVRMAFDLFDTAVTDFDASVRPLAGGVAVRDKMIADLADRLPQLEALVESDEALDAVSLRLAERQGDLAYEQGRHNEALRRYKAFLKGSLRLAELEPFSHDYLDSAVRAYRKYAELSNDPELLYQHGIQFAEEVFDQAPQREEARYNLCQIRVAFGHYLRKSQCYDRALEQLDAALTLCSSEDSRTVDRWAQLAAIARDARGRVLLRLGDGAAGLAELAASLRIRERVVEARPADTRARYDLMLAYSHAATAERDAGHLEEARVLLQKAASLGELLRAMDPTAATWAFSLYAAYDKLARLHLVCGDLAEAQPVCDVAVALAQGLADVGERTREGMSTLAYAHVLRGRVFLARQLREEGYREFEEAAAIRTSLLVADPENPKLRDDLAVANSWLARSSRKMNKFQQALAHYQTAYDIRTELYEEQPHVVERALDLATSGVNLAVAHLDCDTGANDATAAKLLTHGKRRLDALDTDGKLVGLEGRYQRLIAAIHANQDIIRKRTDGRNSGTSDG